MCQDIDEDVAGLGAALPLAPRDPLQAPEGEAPAINAADIDSPLLQAAMWLQSHAPLQSRVSMTHEAERHGVSRRTFVERLHAISEAALRFQSALLGKVLRYVRGGVAAGTVEVLHVSPKLLLEAHP